MIPFCKALDEKFSLNINPYLSNLFETYTSRESPFLVPR